MTTDTDTPAGKPGAITETALELPIDLLTNFAYVADRVEVSRRRETLNFPHHAEVAALSPDQTRPPRPKQLIGRPPMTNQQPPGGGG